MDRIIAVRYDGETNPSVEYLYDNMGSATLRKDNVTQVQTKQLYDFADRLCRIEEKGMGSNALDHAYEWTYDQRDNVASITETLNGTNWEINFAYNADDILTQTTYGNNAFANTFDALGRQTQRTHTVSGSTRMTTTYGYLNPDSTHTRRRCCPRCGIGERSLTRQRRTHMTPVGISRRSRQTAVQRPTPMTTWAS